MAKQYKIRAGFTFVMDDRTVKTGGDVLDLEDDVAKDHAHKLEPVEAEGKKTASKKSDQL